MSEIVEIPGISESSVKRMLLVASVPSMIGAFNMDNIDILLGMGYEVHVACDFKDRSVWDEDKVKQLVSKLRHLNIPCHQIDFSRKLYKIDNHVKAYCRLKKILKKYDFEFVHCHAPIASIITRLAVRKYNKKHIRKEEINSKDKRKNSCVCKLIYTAHGFHFFKGAPLQNWLFYPIEKYFSKYTDILITINNEDYNRAKKSFKMKKVFKIPGIGLDNRKIHAYNAEGITDRRYIKRRELGIGEDKFVVLSVGELNDNKNQQAVLYAMAELSDKDIVYVMVGMGENQIKYNQMIKKLGLEDNVIMAGYRSDILDIYNMSDVMIHPSKREGLGMAPLEAMASGLPIITSDIRGIRDYSKNGVTGYSCGYNDVKGFAKCIQSLKNNPALRKKIGIYNKSVAMQFDISKTREIMTDIYADLGRIKVLHVLNSLSSGGAESFILNLFRNIDREKYMFDFMLRSVNNKKEYVDEVEKLGSKIYITPSFPGHIFRNITAAKSIIRKGGYDAIHVHANSLIYIYPLIAARSAGVPVRILHSHNSTTQHGRLCKLVHCFNKQYVEKYTTVNLACGQLAGKWMFKKNYKIINNGVNFEKFVFNEEKRAKIRSNLGIQDRFVLGTVGRFTLQKNHKFMIEVFSEYVKINAQSVLMLVGSGELEREVRKTVDRYGLKDKVIFMGQCDNIDELLSAMDMFIMTSFFEGLPFALVEAQASGLKSVVSSAVTKEVNVTGLIKYISLERTAQYWAEKIELYREKNVIRKMNDNDLKDYNIAKTVSDMEAVYENRMI